jgi:hypothetical protein
MIINNNPDIQPPERIVVAKSSGRKITRVPVLFPREGETNGQFMARVRRVSDSLNHDANPATPRMRIAPVLVLCLLGLLMWWALWKLVS